MEFESIPNSVDGADNMGGLATEFYYGRTADIEEFPELPDLDTATIETASVVAAADIVMVTGKKMHSMYFTSDMGEITWDEQGPTDGKSVMGKFTISHPGVKNKIASFVRASNNSSMFFLIPNNDGEYYLLGTPKLPAKRAGAKATSGKATGDGKATELTFQAASRCPVLVEVGAGDIARHTAPAVAP
jgi:hypothetical protein